MAQNKEKEGQEDKEKTKSGGLIIQNFKAKKKNRFKVILCSHFLKNTFPFGRQKWHFVNLSLSLSLCLFVFVCLS